MASCRRQNAYWITRWNGSSYYSYTRWSYFNCASLLSGHGDRARWVRRLTTWTGWGWLTSYTYFF